jgi:hypothetical protein
MEFERKGITPARDNPVDLRTVRLMRGLKMIAAISLLAELVGAAAVLWRANPR